MIMSIRIRDCWQNGFKGIHFVDKTWGWWWWALGIVIVDKTDLKESNPSTRLDDDYDGDDDDDDEH